MCGVDARIAPPFMEATDASRLVCVVVVSYQEYSLTPTVCGALCVLGLLEIAVLGPPIGCGAGGVHGDGRLDMGRGSVHLGRVDQSASAPDMPIAEPPPRGTAARARALVVC